MCHSSRGFIRSKMVIGDAGRAILIDLRVLNEAAGRVRSSRSDDIGFLNRFATR